MYITTSYSAKAGIEQSPWEFHIARMERRGDQGQHLKLTFILLQVNENDVTLLVDNSLWNNSKKICSIPILNVSMSVLNEVSAMYFITN